MKKILYIEDDITLRENVAEILAEEGYEVETAPNGMDAFKKIVKTDFDLVLCDIMMPDINGFKVLEEYGNFSGNVPPPFIFISALDDLKNIRKGMELGADDYLPKPFTREELIKAISVRLKVRNDLIQSVPPFGSRKYADADLKYYVSDEKAFSGKPFDYEDSFFVSTANKSEFIFVKDIICVSSNKDYTALNLKNIHTLVVKKSLKAWLGILPEAHFAQIHRSVIININYVVEVKKWFSYTHKVYLKSIEEPFIISQRYSRVLKSQLKF